MSSSTGWPGSVPSRFVSPPKPAPKKGKGAVRGPPTSKELAEQLQPFELDPITRMPVGRQGASPFLMSLHNERMSRARHRREQQRRTSRDEARTAAHFRERAIGLLAEDCQLGMHIGEMRVSRTAQELDRVVTLRHMDTLTRTQRELSRPPTQPKQRRPAETVEEAESRQMLAVVERGRLKKLFGSREAKTVKGKRREMLAEITAIIAKEERERADAERAEYLAARAQTAQSAAMAALLAGPGAQPDEGARASSS